MKNTKKILGLVLALIVLTLAMSLSIFADKPETDLARGYYAAIYNEDGTLAWDVDASKSASEFNVHSALEDLYVFANNAFLIGLKGTPSFELVVYEDVALTRDLDVTGRDITIDVNGHSFGTNGFEITGDDSLTFKCSKGTGSVEGYTLNAENVFVEKSFVAQIGEDKYETFAEALAAAKAMTGDVVVEIYEKVTLNAGFNGSFTSITFVGKDTDAEIYLDLQGYAEIPGKIVAFEDLTLSKVAGGYVSNAGFMNLAFGIYGATEVSYDNCVFANGAYAATGKATFTNCEFYSSHDRYSFWAYGDDSVITIDNCDFVGLRGIKMYSENHVNPTIDLTVKNTDFTAADGKPAIVLTYGTKVTLEDNVYPSKGVFELDLDGKPNGVTVTSDVYPSCINDNGACGVLVDGKIYTTVAQAAEVAVEGSKVTLLYNSAETVELVAGVELDKNGFEAAGITVARAGLKGNGTESDPFLIESLEDLILFRDTVNTYTSDGSNQFKGQYVKLKTDIDLDGINWTPIGTNSVGDHMAFLGTFDGDGHTISNLYINADGDHLGFFARVGSYADDCTPTVKNIKFNNVDVSSNTTNGHGGSYVAGVIANAGGNSVVTNVHVTGDVYVVGYGYVGGIVGHGYPDIDNCSVKAEDGSYIHCHYWCVGGIIGYAGEGGTPITNSSVSGVDIWTAYGAGAAIAGLLQDGNKIENVTAENVEITSNSDYCMGYIAGNGECSTITNVTVNNVTATAKGEQITSTDAVATVNGKVYFSLQAAIDAVKGSTGNTITLLADASISGQNALDALTGDTLDLNDKTLTVSGNSYFSNGTTTFTNGNIVVSGYASDSFFCGYTAGAVIVFDDVVITGDNYKTGCALFNANQGKVEIKNSEITLSGDTTGGVIYGGSAVIDNTTIDATNVCRGITNSVATVQNNSVFAFDGGETCLNNSTVTINNSTVTIENATKRAVRLGDNTLALVNGATLTATNCVADIVKLNDSSNAVVTVDTTSTLNAVDNVTVYVAKIGDKYYTTFEDAVNAIPTDGTDVVIKILTDIELTNSIEFNYGTGKITFTADAPVVIKQTKVGLDLAFTIGKATTIVVDENVTFEIYDNASGMYVYYGPSLVINGSISGGQNWGCLYLYNGTHLVSTTGSINVGRLQIAHTELTVLGAIDTNYLLVEGADFIANGAIIEVGAIHDSNNGGTRWGASDFSFLNGTVVNANTITLKYADSVINLDLSSSITANKIEGIGKIVIDVSGFNGTATQVINADMSGFTGTVELVNGNGKQLYKITDSGLTIVSAVAVIGENYFATLAEALKAANDGDTITLIWAEGDAPIAMSGSVYGKSVTITGTALVDWSKGNLFIGRGGEGNGTVIFDNANLTSASNNASYGIHVSGREKNTNNKYDGTLIIKNSTIVLDYLINKGNMTLDNSTLTVKNGFAIGGRPASETESGADATATITLNNGSKVVVNNHNGMGLGYEAIGVMNVNANSTFECTQDFLVTAKGTLNVNGGTIKVAGTFTNNGTIDVVSGTFSMDPSAFIKEGYSSIKNFDNMYVVGVAPTATVKDYGPTLLPAGGYGVWDGKNYTDKGTVDLPLSFVMQFIANQTAEDVKNSPYADWYGDFVITFTGIEDGSFTADGCYLAGFYGDFGWVKIPVDGMKIEEGVRYPVMLGVGLGQKYDYICSGVKDFKCALYITEDILAANPNLKVNLELAAIDNSKGQDAAAEALADKNSEYTFGITNYEYEAEDFVVKYVAQVGDKKYTSLQEAINAANGETVVILENIDLADTTVTVPAGTTVTLDLNGKVISGVCNANQASMFVIENTATLTVKDSATNGKITYAAGKSNVGFEMDVKGNLILESGTIEMTGSWSLGFAVDVRPNAWGTAYTAPTSFTMNGGKIVSSDTAVRVASNSSDTYAPNNVSFTMNGGVIESGWDAIFVQHLYANNLYVNVKNGYVTGSNSALRIYGDVVSDVYFNVEGGTFVGELKNLEATGNGSTAITGGVFAKEPTNVPDGYAAIKNLDGNYVVGAAPTATVKDYGPTLLPAGGYGVWDGKNYTSKGTVDLPLSFVMQFLADQTAQDVENSPYADWYADFVITFTGIENGSFVADGCYLAGFYGDFGWVKIPVDGMKIEEGVRYPVMLGVGLGQKYDYICSGVKDFKCALYITEEILEANPGLKVNLELAVVDNSKGESAAADALVNNESVYNVVDYDYEAEDFIVNYVASVGEKNFTSLADAFKYANANGGTITLLEDITIDTETFTINSDAEITLDMNGKKISVVDKKEGSDTRANYELFYILGKLTVTGNGTIELTSTYDRDWNAMSAIFHNRGGVLTIENGTYTNNGGTDMAYVIDNSGNSFGDVVTTINGGTFTTTYIAVRNRMDTYGKYGHGSVTLNINGGELTGKYAVWGQVSSTGVKGTVNVTGGKLTSAQGKTTILMDTDATGEMTVAVSGGIFSSAVEESYCLEGYIPVANNDGTFGVKEGAFVVRNTTTGVGYESLEAAITAAQAGDVIELLADVEATTVILIDKSLTINGNNHKVTSSANRVFRVTTSNTQVTLNDVNMVSTAVRVGTNDIRGISIDILDNVKLTLNNCSVDFTDASACDWAYAVNLTGGSNNTVTVNGGTYEGANVINVRGASQTVVVKDATLTSLYPNNDVYYGACIYVVQNENSSVTATDNTFNGSNAVAFNVGYTPITESNNIDNTKRVVAKIGNTYYTSLQDAIAAGGEVKLLANITLTETITVTGTVTLDLNGKVITGTDNNTSGNFYLINVNKGNLTINDTVGTGAITLEATVERNWSSSSVVVANNQGTVTVNGGTIEHLGGTSMAYAIDNLTNGTIGDANLVINGGKVESTYFAVRQFANSNTNENNVTVTGGNVGYMWIQSPNSYVNNADLTVTAGTVSGICLSGVNAEITLDAKADCVGEVYGNAPAGECVIVVDGKYTLTKAVAKIGDTYYATLQEAFNAGGNVVLLDNVNITSTIKLVAGKTVTLDLNGYTIDGIGNVRIAIMSYGDLTIKDSSAEKTGAIKAGIGTGGNAINICAGTFTFESGNIYSLNNAILIDEQAATVNILGGKITAEPSTKNSAVFYISSTSNTVVNISGGEMVGYNGMLIWNNNEINISGGTITATGSTAIQGNGTCDNTKITIENGKLSGKWAAIYHPQNGELNISGGELTGYTGVVIKSGKVTISGGTFNGTGAKQAYQPVSSGYVDTGDALYIEHYDNSTNSENYGTPTVTVTGGTFVSANGKAVASYANTNNNVEKLTGFISGGIFSTDVSDLCAEGFVCVENENGMFGIIEGLKGSGTEADPYQIGSLEDLIFFRDSVNAGETRYNAVGVYVALTDNIDMSSVDWSVNIGDDCNATFDGIFDGKGYTISNLNSTETAQKSDGYICTGLFGAIYGSATIKNLTIKNVSINTGDFTGNNVGAVVGFAYNCTGSIENVTVNGDIKINANGAYGVGAIVGYDYGSTDLKITNCKVSGSEGSYINAVSGVGGIIGYSNGAKISGCTVENVSISGLGLVGGIVGTANPNTVVDTVTVKNVVLTATKSQWVNGVAIAVGTISGNGVTVANVTYENVNADRLVGSVYVEQPTTVVSKVPAKVGNKYYVTLDAAITAANGGTVELLAPIVVNKGEEVTIDLKGATVVYNSTTINESMFTNYGKLVINDTVGTGVINYNYTGAADPSHSKGNYTINNAGTLTVNGGKITIANLRSHAKYPINNNSINSDAIVEINGGWLYNYNTSAIRMICGTYKNSVTINGGLVEGYCAIWVQNPGKNTVNCELTINGGEIKSTAAAYVNGTAELKDVASRIYFTTEGGAWSESSFVALNGGTFNENVDLVNTAPNDYTIGKATFNGFVKLPVAEVNGVKYATLQEAIDNANGGVVTLLAPIVVNKGEEVTIDLKGATVVYNSTTINESMFTNYGKLVINDTVGTGVINYNYTGAADPSFGMGNYTINNAGTLTVNGGKITIANLRSHAKYPINNNSTSSDAILVINGGHLYNYNTSAIRMFCNSTTYKNSVTINGGLVEGYCAIWVQNPGKNTVNCELTINGGEIKSTAAAYVNGTAELKDVASRIYFSTEGGAWSESSFVALNGGTFNENVDLVNTAPNNYTIGKATFNGFVKLPVAEVNGVKYATLQEAIDNANGGVVTLLAPIVIEKGETVEIDLKGATVVYSVAKAEKSVAMITNKGTLTIKDSVSGGKLSFTYTGESYGYGKGMYTISNEGGTLNITGGTIENLTNVSGSMYDAIDNNSTLGNTVLNISGGTISCPAYIAIRYFANSTTYENVVNVTGGTINGGNCSIWVQNPGSNQPLAALNVENGTFIGRILLGTSSGFTTAIKGGTFSTDVNAQCAEGYICVANGDGTYTVREGKFVAQVDDTKYESLAEAFANANGSTVTLLADITLTETITVTGTVTLDLNGKTITGTDNSTASFSLFTNKGNLTITGNGTITLVATNNRGWGSYSTIISNTVGGNLTVENGTFTHLGGTNMAYVIDNLTNGKGTYAETTINGGTFTSTYVPVRQFLNGVEAENILTVNGGTFTGGRGRAIYFQSPSAKANTGTLTINAGAILNDSVYFEIPTGTTKWAVEVSIDVSVFAEGVTKIETDDVPEGYVIDEINGRIVVREANYVAQVGDKKYESLAEAIAAGGEVKLLADITLTESITVTGTVKLDLAGFDITMTLASVNGTTFAIKNNGTLTIKNSTDEVGEICLTYTGARNNNASISTIGNYGTLNIEGGKINCVAGNQNIAYAIDTFSVTSTDVSVNISGGEVCGGASGYSIRMFMGSTIADNALNVTGGKVGYVWAQNVNANANKVTINVTGGSVAYVYVAAATGAFDVTNVTLNVKADCTEYTPYVGISGDEYELRNVDGVYKIVKCNYVAQVGDTKYESLAEAIANANGGTVTLLADIELNEAVVINADVTIDLANFTVANVDTEVNCVFHIENGTVVIKNGTISTNNGQAIYAGLKDNAEYAPVVTLENVTLEGADFGLSVFGGANVTIGNGVAISGSVEALRVWNSAKVTVNADATITCTGNGNDARAIAVYEAASVSVVGGTFTGAVDAIAYNGKTPTLVITGGTFTVDVNQYCANGYICVADGEAYIVREGKFVAEVNGVKYETLQAAIDAANGGTVTLLETFVVNAGETVALDLKGCTIVGNASGDKAYEVIRNNGTLTITNGTVVCNSTSSSTAFAINTITNCGSLTITNATIKNVGAGNQIGYAIDNNSTSYNATLVVGEGAVITAEGSAYFDGIRLFCNSLTAENNVTVNGGKVSSIWMQNPSDGATDKNTKPVKGSVTITNGTVNGLYIEPSSNFELAISGGNIGTVATFGTANTVETEIAKGITGGTFTVDVNQYCADGYICVADGNGTYTIKKLFKVLGTNVYLDTDLSIDFIYDGAEFNGTDYYAVIKKCHAENCVCDATTYYVVFGDEFFKADKSGYVHVKANNIAAKEMVCDIEVVIYKGTYEIAEDGTVTENGYAVSQKAVDSIAKYAERGYNYYKVGGAGEALMTDAKREAYFRTLANMLVYGAEAQKFFHHYETVDGGLATTINDTVKTIVANYATENDVVPELEYSVTRDEAEGTTYFAGANIDLENTIFFNLYFINIDFEKEFDAKIVFTHRNGDKHEYSISAGTLNYSENNGFLQVNIDDLAPADLRLDVECIVTVEGEQVSRVVISVEDYLAHIRANDPANASMYNAVINYADAAKKYFYGN